MCCSLFSPYETNSNDVNHKCQQPFAILFQATLARSIPTTWRGCSSRPEHVAATWRAASSNLGSARRRGSSCLGGRHASACLRRRCSRIRAAERAPRPGRMQARSHAGRSCNHRIFGEGSGHTWPTPAGYTSSVSALQEPTNGSRPTTRDHPRKGDRTMARAARSCLRRLWEGLTHESVHSRAR